ncbi:MAG: RluA family pseudouridine synthase [Treponema sp.]|nr:RluA family pseudouridine synthase [Treponema sp.]
MPSFSIQVPDDYAGGGRLDSYVASLPGGMNRSHLKSGLLQILVNGKARKPSYKIRPGDKILIDWEDTVPDDIEPENIPLSIIYEDSRVCVIDKAQGMVTHPAAGNWKGTLVNALLYHLGREKIEQKKDAPESELLLSRRPGIVHRLDKDTSGVIITAKDSASQEWLSAQFRNHRRMVKEYIAICQGRPPSSQVVIRTWIVRDPRDRKRFKAVSGSGEGKYAETAYRCIACYGEYSLVVLRLATGRTHQIRVHMRYLNCPVLGDILYGHEDKNFPHATLMLHARLLKIRLPGDWKASGFRSSTPARFRDVMRVLHRKYKKVILPKAGQEAVR